MLRTEGNNVLKANLDRRICDVESDAKNTETYREFMVASENEFGIPHKILNDMEPVKLKEYFDFLNELWFK